MSSYIIDFTNTSGETGSILADAGFNYSDRLNQINEANIKISGSSPAKRSLIEIGSEAKIYRNNVLEFHGLVNNVDFLDGGGISASVQGFEIWLAKENGDYANSPWISTASATIFSDVIAESNYLTAGTINAGLSIDQRLVLTDSLWNSINNLRVKTSQDIGIDYPNSEIDILDHKGSTSSVLTLNAGIQIKDIRVSHAYPMGNDVRVYGKGDGDNQIKSNPAVSGQDASSKSTYGTIRKIHRDPSVLTVAEGDILADALVAIYKDPVKIYDFDVINPNQSIVSGDVVTINSQTQGLINEEVRIVGIERGVRNGHEFLILEVTNKEYSRLLKNKNQIVAEIDKNFRDHQTYMHGTTNVLTFSQQINATATAPLRTQGNLPAAFILDEAGKLRVNSFTCDYDVDPFRSNIATASEDSIAPGVSGASASSDGKTLIDSDTDGDKAIGSGGFTTLGDIASGVAFTGFTNDVLVKVRVTEVSGGPEDIEIRITNTYPSTVARVIAVDNFDSNSFISVEVGDFTTGAGEHLQLSARYITGAITVNGEIQAFGSSHGHADGTYSADSHNHNVSVGDAVSDAGSINATQVDIYVDHWNGSAWINKHSILNTGKTLDTDVDISDGGTYPDAAGYWRTRIFTDNATADLVNSIMKVKHELDT